MNAPTPWDASPPADYERRNVVPLHRGYVRPIDAHRTARALNDAEMVAAIEQRLNETRHVTAGDRPQHQRNNLARFYRANPQFGPARAVEGGHDSHARLPFAERLVLFFRLNGEALTFWFAMGAVGVLLATVVGGYLGGAL